MSASGALVERHDAGAAEPEIVLQTDPRAFDLCRCRGTAKLPRQLVALREAGRAERMALRQETTGRIGDDATAIGVVAVIDELGRLALLAEAKTLIGDQLVLGEAVVQLDDVEIIRPDPCGLID